MFKKTFSSIIIIIIIISIFIMNVNINESACFKCFCSTTYAYFSVLVVDQALASYFTS